MTHPPNNATSDRYLFSATASGKVITTGYCMAFLEELFNAIQKPERITLNVYR